MPICGMCYLLSPKKPTRVLNFLYIVGMKDAPLYLLLWKRYAGMLLIIGPPKNFTKVAGA